MPSAVEGAEPAMVTHEHVRVRLGSGQMKPCYRFLLIITLLLGVTETSMAQTSMEPWLTRSADNSRSGWNSRERQLTQMSVASKGLIRATTIPVIGDARGMEAQPLILPNVKTASGTRDVLVLPSMADIVRGVDAHDGSGIWQVTLGVPVTKTSAGRSRSTICRLPSALVENRRAAPNSTRYQHSTGLHSL